MAHELTPYLSVPDARAAIDWYAQVLGAVVTYEPIVMPDGRIGHVELDADGAHWMMADAHPEIRSPAPTPGEGSPVTLHLTVADVDAITERARAAGADDRPRARRQPGRGPDRGPPRPVRPPLDAQPAAGLEPRAAVKPQDRRTTRAPRPRTPRGPARPAPAGSTPSSGSP